MKIKNTKGLSGIVTAILMIALVMAAAVLIWGVVSSTIKKQVESTESCFGNFEKVTLNRIYTCYDYVNNYFRFSINIGDIDVEKVIVAVSSEGTTKNYEITSEGGTISGLGNYPSPSFGAETISLPGKNEGKTYVSNEFSDVPDLIKIAPVIDGQQCEVSDSVSDIGSC